ncbi:MAG: alanine--tRNA ligase-related protein [Candidatus Shikimatogenerans bostrichidophilus]|nr:MAG: alanine--tRNA ligase-related protein [Candidatus Shikimatogenerans bostrichidophilus]
MKYNKIKKIFIEYFKNKKHKIYKSLSIVNKDKSNLMFINSGIIQFKKYFLGIKNPKYLRIANIQKCIRITGKSSDLKLVGYDNYHHTMFEMLGNWSFGDYSLKLAIKYALELIIKKYKISKDNIYITIFKGNKFNNLVKDYESYNICKKLINKKNILFFGLKHNFWKIDNFNLCGPSVEIHIDIRNKKLKKKILGYKLINKNNKYLIELWNIVNIKYLIKNNIIYKNNNKLSNNFIDTGMGLERLCMILQKKKSTYDTDLFKPIIKKIEKILLIKYKKNNKYDLVIKIVSDHIRSIFIIMLNDIKPNNKKHGYIIKKLIRRSLIYTYKYLNFKKPFLFKLINIVYKTFYKKKKNNKIKIIKLYLKKEEKLFFLSLKKNIKIMKKLIYINYLKLNKKFIDKKFIYFLYETYGLFYFIIKKYIIKKKLILEIKKNINNNIEI